LRLRRGAPVRMTIEGIGETRSLADALSLLCFYVCSNALNILLLLFGIGLETLVAVTPEFWPRRSHLDLVGGFRFLSTRRHIFSAARARRAARRSAPCFVLAFLSDAIVFCCAAADEMSCGISAMTSPTASAAANTALGMFFFLYFQSQGALPVGNRPQSATGAQR
jgi:hypothetical protein